MKLQIALDFMEKAKALDVIKKAEKYMDWIEVGTPLLIIYGVNIIKEVKKLAPSKPIVADMKLLGLVAFEMEHGFKAGADLVSTDRCGYTKEELHKREMIQQLEDEIEYTKLLSKQTEKEPDIKLVSLLAKEVKIPVICEGRIWTPEQVCSALKAGAYAVVIGGAITKPNVITRRFVDVMNKSKP